MKFIFITPALLLQFLSAAFCQDETLPVWRAQLKIQTCKAKDSQTDDPVRCSLNKDQKFTALDYPRNDFPKDGTFTYDLVLGGINQVSEIQQLKIYKLKKDGVCFKALTLYINEQPVYDTVFEKGRWLDDKLHAQFLLIEGNTLRSHPSWKTLSREKTLESLLVIGNQDIKSIIAAQFGTLMSGNDLTWGPQPKVEVKKRDENSLSCDIKFSAVLPIQIFDPEIHAKFNIVTCKNGQPVFLIEGKAADILKTPFKGLNDLTKLLPPGSCYQVTPKGDLSLNIASPTTNPR